MIVLADNDLILKLAQCDLLESLHLLLGIDENYQLQTTATARYQVIPKNEEKALAKAGNESILVNLKLFFEKAIEIQPLDDHVLIQMENLDGIDSGEQLLFATMLSLPSSLLVIGDKRALTAVLNNKLMIPDIFSALEGRVLTFESAILLAIIAFGFPNVKQRLLGNPSPDGVLRNVLKNDMSESDLIECLVSYSRDQLPFLARKDLLNKFYTNKME